MPFNCLSSIPLKLGIGMLRRTLFAVGCWLLPAVALAHGNLSLEDDKCKLKLGPYEMHFAGYQPDATQTKEFCEDIPAVGRTVVVLDAIDTALRALPVAVQVFADHGDPAAEDGAVPILHVAPRRYPDGSVAFEYEFKSAGKFVGVVTAGDPPRYVARFPFSVGGATAKWRDYGLLGLLLLAGPVLLAYAMRTRTKHLRKAAPRGLVGGDR